MGQSYHSRSPARSVSSRPGCLLAGEHVATPAHRARTPRRQAPVASAGDGRPGSVAGLRASIDGAATNSFRSPAL